MAKRLDARILGIGACVALICALGAGFLASIVLGEDDPPPARAELVPVVDPDPHEVLAVPLETVEGEPTDLAAWQGDKPLLVNLWAQSCVPCIEEMPLFEQLHQTDDRVDMFGVDILDSLDRAEQLAAQTGITYPWVRDPMGELFVAAQGAFMPVTFMLGPDGSLMATKTGAFADQADLGRWVDEALARP